MSEAIKTVRLVASTVTDSTQLIPFIVLLIENIQSHQHDLPATTEIYQLLIESYAKHPRIALPEDIIIKSIDTETWSYRLTDSNLAMQIYRLQWMLCYANMSEEVFFQRKVADIMSKKDVHHILASGMKCSDEGLYRFSSDWYGKLKV